MEQVSEWRNATNGQIGVVKYNEEGKRRAIAVGPGKTVTLTQRERVATANAPAKAEDNPFANGNLVLVNAEADLSSRRPIGDTSAPPAPEPTPEPPAETPPAPETPEAPEVPEPADETEKASEPAETGAPPVPPGPAPQGSRIRNEEAASPPVPRPTRR